MTHADTLVSVIIPTYNRPDYVERAIESVRAQTFRDWELIVVDDGSAAETCAVLKPLALQDKRIRVLRIANCGTAAARNRGLEKASGKYVAFLDDDDEWLPEMLEVEVGFIESHPEIGLCYSRLQILREVDGKMDDRTVFPKIMGTGFPDLLTRCLIMPSTAIMRRSCLTELGGFDPAYVLQDDTDLWLRFSQRFKIAAIDRALARTHKDGRVQKSHNFVASLKSAINVISHLKLQPGFERYEGLRTRHIAKSYAAVPICLILGVTHAGR